jgi:hypothetical protein
LLAGCIASVSLTCAEADSAIRRRIRYALLPLTGGLAVGGLALGLGPVVTVPATLALLLAVEASAIAFAIPTAKKARSGEWQPRRSVLVAPALLAPAGTCPQDCRAHVDGSDTARLSTRHLERPVSLGHCCGGRPLSEPSDARKARRRRRGFAMRLAPVAVALLAFGIPFADHGGALRVLAVVALAQGIGLAVALVWLALGHNPLSRE